jgi:hypothetical protein
MKSNSTKYHIDTDFTSQRTSTRDSQHEVEAHDVERWDHSGFCQLQLEQQNEYSKLNHNKAEKTMAVDYIEISNHRNDSVNENAQDKYQENLHDFSPILDNERNSKETLQRKNRKEKKPDRQLYSARMRNEELKKMKEKTIQLPDRLNCSEIETKEDFSPFPQMAKEVLAVLEGKEIYELEDDRLSISNVSTAMSDKLKSWEEESYIKGEIKVERDHHNIIKSPKDKESTDVLFDLLLETEKGITNVRFYHGEEDYEAFLDKLCTFHNFQPRIALYFKISVLQQVKEIIVDSEQLDIILDKLLDINYQLLMDEEKMEEAEESITPDIKREIRQSEAILKHFEDSD